MVRVLDSCGDKTGEIFSMVDWGNNLQRTTGTLIVEIVMIEARKRPRRGVSLSWSKTNQSPGSIITQPCLFATL